MVPANNYTVDANTLCTCCAVTGCDPVRQRKTRESVGSVQELNDRWSTNDVMDATTRGRSVYLAVT
jgi:hypothetical protein